MATDIQSLPSQYDHAAAQGKWYAFWEERGYFHADPASEKEPFSVVIPPPNVTGALHLGHALNNTLQDILCRMRRMQGYEVLWMPGTDHAGIATQAVVERRVLEEEGKSRHDLGREGLVDRIWDWKREYEKRILGQLKQMGFSCDWERLRFTLDDQCARAVRETFFQLFKDEKTYRGKRLVNWDTFLQTAVSDDEVFHDPVKGHFWHFRYPVIDPKPGEPEFVTIATTRPETMLGDTAVAVHPDPAGQLDKVEAELNEKLVAAPDKEKDAVQAQIDALAERRKTKLTELEQLRDMAADGRKLRLPLADREIPLIADVWAKPELGSGCVKITPAHDANDYEVWQRNPQINARNIMERDGTLNDAVPEKYRGLTMKRARAAVVEDLVELGLHDPENDREDREIDLAHSDRSKTPIEPYLADQWFVKMDELAQTAMDAVTDGRVKIVPDRYAKSYLDWLGEKRDWPVGRQLWWGHRIPVWHFRDMSQRDFSETTPRLESFLSLFDLEPQDYSVQRGDTPIDFAISAKEVEQADGARSDKLKEAMQYLESFRKSTPNTTTLDSLHGSDDVELPSTRTVPLGDERARAAQKIGHLTLPEEDEEVLDTWFSSALWPHSTMGWPEETAELERFYPTSTLITSRDIITLWVARMVLMGEFNMNDIPFHEVYIHPKILDGYGETMSKSKGNGVDPLDIIDKYGADSLRFGLAYLTTETQDVRMPVEFECPHCGCHIKQTKKNRVLPRVECDSCGKPFGTQWSASHGTEDDKQLLRGAAVSERFELARNFCNKLWNASRFALMNLEGYEAGPVADADLLLEDRWLLSRLATTTQVVTESLNAYKYAEASRALYDFAWDEFCSFYVEMTKARFAVPEQRVTAQRVLAYALDQLLRLLHPMTPFVTEEVWQLLGEVAPERGLETPSPAEDSVCIAAWPEADVKRIDAGIEEQFAQFQAVMGAVRNIRTEKNIPPKESVEFTVRCEAPVAGLLEPMRPYFESMARATATAIGPDAAPAERVASKALSGMEVHVDISAFFDVGAERKRLEKELAEKSKFATGLENKLGNENFVSRAPANVVQEQRDKLAEVKEQLSAVEAALAKLS